MLYAHVFLMRICLFNISRVFILLMFISLLLRNFLTISILFWRLSSLLLFFMRTWISNYFFLKNKIHYFVPSILITFSYSWLYILNIFLYIISSIWLLRIHLIIICGRVISGHFNQVRKDFIKIFSRIIFFRRILWFNNNPLNWINLTLINFPVSLFQMILA